MVRRQRPFVSHHREVTLMLFHHRDEHISGQRQVFLLKNAAHGGGLLHQVGHFIAEGRVFGDSSAHFSGQSVDLPLDASPTLVHIHDDRIGSHHVKIGAGLLDGQLRRAQGPQPTRGRPTLHTGVLEGDHLVAQQSHQPADGAREGHSRLVPAHGHGEAQGGDQLRQQPGQDFRCGPAFLYFSCDHVLSAIYLPHFQLINTDALSFGKALSRLGRLALYIVSHSGWRALDQFFPILLFGSQALDVDRQPSWGARHPYRAVLQSRFGQEFGCLLPQLLDSRRQIGGGQFLRPYFQQQVLGSFSGSFSLFSLPLWPGGIFYHPRALQAGEAHLLPLGDIGLSHLPGQVAHAGEVVRPLGHPDRPSGVQQVESVGAAEDIVVGGNNQAAGQGAASFGLVHLEKPGQGLHVGLLEGIGAVLDLLGQQDVAVAQPRPPVNLPHAAHALQEHDDALQAIGQLHRDRVEGESAGLLKIGVLADLQAVQPDLPTQAPGPQGRALPVVLDEADIVLAGVDAQSLQALEVELLGVAGVRLEDDLVLDVHLHAVGVLAIAAVVGAVGGLHVPHVPGLRPQDAQHGGRVHGAGPYFLTVRLPDDASLLGPEMLQAHDDLLER